MIALHNTAAQSIVVSGRLSSTGYSGETFDLASQQQYLRARFYSPGNGRFNRLDDFAGNNQDPQSLHKYAYVHGDPISGIDPTGEFLVIAALFVLVTIGFIAFDSPIAYTPGPPLPPLPLAPSKTRSNVKASFRERMLARLDTSSVKSRKQLVSDLGEPPNTELPPGASISINATLAPTNEYVSLAWLNANGKYLGPQGCGPCVGLILIDDDTVHSFHFDNHDDPYDTLWEQDQTDIYKNRRAVLLGGTEGPESRRSTMRILQYLKSTKTPIIGYHDGDSLYVDGNGNLFRRQPFGL